MLEQRYVDFILSQALREDSIVNMNKEEYGYLVDRAVEDLGKHDFMKQNNCSKSTYMYLTRNYVDHDNISGVHDSRRKTITLKKSQIDKLYNGKVDVFDTIFHENQHMSQYNDLGRMPISFMRYNMLKEQVIMDCTYDYYTRNYTTTYIEIEAREKGCERAAEYLAKIMPTERIADSIEQLGDDVSELFSNKFDKEKERLLEQSTEEKKLYEDADKKLYKDGNRRPLQSIFEDIVSEDLIKSKIKKYPGLLIEYNENGKRKNFFELLSFADSQGLNLEMIQQIIKSSNTMEQGDNIDTIYGIINYINNNGMNAKKCEFMKKVLSENFVSYINKLSKDLSSKSYLKDDDLRMYNSIQSIIDAAKREGSYNYIFAHNSCKNGLTPLSGLEFYQKSIEKRFPTIKVKANSIKQRDEEQKRLKEKLDAERKRQLKQNTSGEKKKKGLFGLFKFSYKDAKKISDEADISGKQTVLNFEKSLELADRTNLDL